MLSMEYVRSRPLRLPSSGRPPPARLRPSHAVLPPPTALVPEDEYGSARRDKKHYFGSRITSVKVACTTLAASCVHIWVGMTRPSIENLGL